LNGVSESKHKKEKDTKQQKTSDKRDHKYEQKRPTDKRAPHNGKFSLVAIQIAVDDVKGHDFCNRDKQKRPTNDITHNKEDQQKRLTRKKNR